MTKKVLFSPEYPPPEYPPPDQIKKKKKCLNKFSTEYCKIFSVNVIHFMHKYMQHTANMQ